jgi:hypothetical protein
VHIHPVSVGMMMMLLLLFFCHRKGKKKKKKNQEKKKKQHTILSQFSQRKLRKAQKKKLNVSSTNRKVSRLVNPFKGKTPNFDYVSHKIQTDLGVSLDLLYGLFLKCWIL